MRDFKIYIFIASVLMVLYLIGEYERPKPINWTHSFLKTDKIPLGTYILYNRLNDIFPGADIQTYREPVYNVLSDHNIKHATYIIIDASAKLNEFDFKKLTAFIKQGNDVFIASENFGSYLSEKQHIWTDDDGDYPLRPDTIHFVNAKLDTNRLYTVEIELHSSYFGEFDTTKAVVLAQNSKHHSTLIKYNFGKGALILSSNPTLFSNYNMLNPLGADYAATVLSHLKNSKTILWDEYYTLGRDSDESIMRVFFTNPSLKWAYLISLITLIIYVLYQMKRQQRIIPIVVPLPNSTVDFVNVVGQVYYELRDNSNIAQKKVTYLLEYIRQKYRLQTTVLDYEFMVTLGTVTGMSMDEVQELMSVINITRDSNHISDKELIKLNDCIEKFYAKAR